jgi:hypothetical protein
MSIWINGKNIIEDDFCEEPKPKFSRTTFVKNTVISIYLFIKQFFYVPLWSKHKIDDNVKDVLPDEDSDGNALLNSPTKEDVLEDEEDNDEEEIVEFVIFV